MAVKNAEIDRCSPNRQDKPNPLKGNTMIIFYILGLFFGQLNVEFRPFSKTNRQGQP